MLHYIVAILAAIAGLVLTSEPLDVRTRPVSAMTINASPVALSAHKGHCRLCPVALPAFAATLYRRAIRPVRQIAASLLAPAVYIGMDRSHQ